MKTKDNFYRNLFVVLVVMAGLGVLYQTASLLIPVFCGLLLAYICYPLVQKLTDLGVPKGISIFLIFIALFFTIVYTTANIIPTIESEIEALTASKESHKIENSRILRIMEEISEQLQSYRVIKEKWNSEQILLDLQHSLRERSVNMFGYVGAAKNTFQFFLISLFVFVFALLDGDQIYRTIVGFFPNSIFEPGVLIFRRTSDLFGDYLRGLVIENFILGLAAFFLLGILSFITSMTLTMCFIIAVIIALTNVIRIVGPFIGAFLGALLVLLSSPDIIAIAGVLFIAGIIQVIDNVAVLPLVMREQVDIHPVVCLLSIIAGGMIAGILGMILAIPVTGAIKVIYGILTREMKKFNLDPDIV